MWLDTEALLKNIKKHQKCTIDNTCNLVDNLTICTFFVTRISPTPSCGPAHSHALHPHPSPSVIVDPIFPVSLLPGEVAPVLAILLSAKNPR